MILRGPIVAICNSELGWVSKMSMETDVGTDVQLLPVQLYLGQNQRQSLRLEIHNLCIYTRVVRQSRNYTLLGVLIRLASAL